MLARACPPGVLGRHLTCVPSAPCFLQPPSIPWLWGASQHSPWGPAVTPSPLIPAFCLRLARTLRWQQAHLGRPGCSRRLEVLNLITPATSLWTHKVTCWQVRGIRMWIYLGAVTLPQLKTPYMYHSMHISCILSLITMYGFHV